MILGHKKQRHILRYLAETDKIAHAYLFSGVSQLGKRTIALEFIKLLDCSVVDFTKRPCQVCYSCKALQKNQHPDFIIVEPRVFSSADVQKTKKKQEIKIAQIRDIQQKLSFSSYSAPIKAVILDEAHTLNQEAASAFLKILEEPKGRTIFILISSHPEMILPTILSRVQIIKFFPIALPEIEVYLKQKRIPETQIQEIISLSLGRPGIVIDYLLNPDKLKDEKDKIQELEKLIQSNLSKRFEYAKTLSKAPQELKDTLDVWLKYLRKTLLSKISLKNLRISHDEVSNYSLIKIKKILEIIQKTNFLLSSTNVNSQLALEILMIKL